MLVETTITLTHKQNPDILAKVAAKLRKARTGTAKAQAATKNAWTVSAQLEPVHWRAQHDPLPDARNGKALGQSPQQITDSHGQIAAPIVAYDTLGRMLKAATITKSEHDSGRRFQEDFEMAGLDPLRAASLWGGSSSAISDEPPGTAVEAARRRIQAALGALGGMDASLGAKALWDVAGWQLSLKDWAKSLGDRRLEAHGASGILASALSVLDLHYNGGLPKRVNGGFSICCNEPLGPRPIKRQNPRAVPETISPLAKKADHPGGVMMALDPQKSAHKALLDKYPEYASKNIS